MKIGSNWFHRPVAKVASVLIFRISFFLFLPIIAIFFPSSPATGFAWDFANLLGYVGVGLFLILLLHSTVPWIFPAINRTFYNYFHCDLAFLALKFISSHIIILLLQQPLLIEHLKLTAPLFMLAGLLAAIFILLLIISSLSSIRNKFFKKFILFRLFHKWLAVIIIILMTYHLIGSDYYLKGFVKQTLFIAIILGVTSMIFFKFQSAAVTNEQKIVMGSKASMFINFLLLLLFGLFCLIATLIKQAL